MGFFDNSDNNDNSDSDQANALIQQQINQSQLELQQKRDALYKTQIGIVKSNAGEDYQGSGANAPVVGKT